MKDIRESARLLLEHLAIADVLHNRGKSIEFVYRLEEAQAFARALDREIESKLEQMYCKCGTVKPCATCETTDLETEKSEVRDDVV